MIDELEAITREEDVVKDDRGKMETETLPCRSGASVSSNIVQMIFGT